MTEPGEATFNFKWRRHACARNAGRRQEMVASIVVGRQP